MVTAIEKDSAHGKIIKLVASIFLAIQILRPLPGIAKLRFEELSPVSIQDAKAIAQEGQLLARKEQEEVITEELEAYILSKDSPQDPEFEVQIFLSEGEPPVPVSAVIRGSLTQEEQQALQTVLEEDLEIAREHQRWIGSE